MIILGIDPGLTGAVAVLDGEGKLLDVYDMPVITMKVGKSIKRRLDARGLAVYVKRQMDSAPCYAYVEQVGAMPKQGVSSTFNFGQSYGIILGIIAAYGLPFKTLTPSYWKGKTGLTGQPKDASRMAAIREWPEMSHMFSLKKHDGRSDAALIGLAGVRK